VSVRVLLVEPNRLLRRGMHAELSADGAEVVAEAATGNEAIAAAAQHQPDVVVLNATLPDRPVAEVCDVLASRLPQSAIIVVGHDQAAVDAAVAAGAEVHRLNDAAELDLGALVRRVAAHDPQVQNEEPRLTRQEVNVLRLAAEGLTNPEIGSRLYLSRHTVKEYLSHAMRKLDAANRIDAVRKATALGLIAGVPSPAREQVAETLVYNESDSPARSSDLKVPPLKLDQLERRTE